MPDEKRIEGEGFLNKNRKDLCTGKYMDLLFHRKELVALLDESTWLSSEIKSTACTDVQLLRAEHYEVPCGKVVLHKTLLEKERFLKVTKNKLFLKKYKQQKKDLQINKK